jgi:hypothetical protein
MSERGDFRKREWRRIVGADTYQQWLHDPQSREEGSIPLDRKSDQIQEYGPSTARIVSSSTEFLPFKIRVVTSAYLK